MVKAAVEAGGAFVMASPDNEVGAACRVNIRKIQPEDGASVVDFEGIARVRITNRRILPGSFGMIVGEVEVIEDKGLDEILSTEADALALVALGLLRRLLEMKMDAEQVDGVFLRAMRLTPSELSMWLIENLRPDVSQRFAWLGMDSPVDRLRDQTQVLRAALSIATKVSLAEKQAAEAAKTSFGEEEALEELTSFGIKEPSLREGEGVSLDEAFSTLDDLLSQEKLDQMLAQAVAHSKQESEAPLAEDGDSPLVEDEQLKDLQDIKAPLTPPKEADDDSRGPAKP
mmetsp:Transcript_10980/g.26652  ORF Transcript_10980/g.26652 Transcript_10980/m.26652 type:complete len:286 (+) Transcript_10980:195-1052(+)